MDDARSGRSRWPFTPNPDDAVKTWATPVVKSTTPVPAGRLLTDDGREINLDEPAPDLDPEQHFGHEPEMHTDEEWAKVRDKANDAWLTGAVDRLTELGFFIAAPGVKVEILPDDEQVRTVSAEDFVTMAEEPIEHRLRRAYENGLKQGLELGHQAFGNWDHR